MKINTTKLLNSLAMLVMFLAFSLPAKAEKTYYSKVTATASANGKVYASASADVEDSQITASSQSATHSSGAAYNNSNYGDHWYFVFAKGDDGYNFEKWSDGDTTNPRRVHLKASSTTENSPTTATYTASFVPAALVAKSANPSVGFVKISKPNNQIGDEVTLTAEIVKPHNSSEFSAPVASTAIKFLGWYDSAGNKLSGDLVYKHTVDKADVLEAKFEREFTVTADDGGNIEGYYRLETPLRSNTSKRYFLCLTGNFAYKINDKTTLNGAVEFNRVPERTDGKYASTEAVYADAGSILYVTGKAKAANLHAVADRVEVATNLVASAQGTDTKKISGYEMTLKTSGIPGFYIVANSIGSLQLTYQKQIYVTSDKPAYASYVEAGDFDIQPIDEAHIDDNYFGPYFADDSQLFDGYYWTTMYTAFPYICYEPDGVTVYAVTHAREVAGKPYPILKEIESGIVPAETPVVLRCKSKSPKGNRLIPLLPGDSRLDYAELAAIDNLLKGEYSLWSAKDCTGKPTYDDSSMRLFSVKNGEPGFYRVETALSRAAGDPELASNSAYLAMDNLPEEYKDFAEYPLRIEDPDGNVTGVDGVLIDSFDHDSPAEYFTLDGRKVARPEKGRFYIVRKGSRASKIIY